MSNFKELMDITLKHAMMQTVKAILEPNPIMEAFYANIKAEWDALPWYKKIYRRINQKIRAAKRRIADGCRIIFFDDYPSDY